MELEIGQSLAGFRVETKEPLSEIDGIAYTLIHEASKARLLYLANQDNNKAFSITFKTPPKDDTGVFHILEHSVLCGSRNVRKFDQVIHANVSQCNDVSRQNDVSGCKHQRPRPHQSHRCLYGCGTSPQHLP